MEMLWWRKIESGGKAPKDESAAAADDKYRYLPNYYKVKGSESNLPIRHHPCLNVNYWLHVVTFSPNF